jgi:hypothetical protein
MTHKLRYIGHRVAGRENDFIPGVPAADCEVETKKEAEALVGSGLYEHFTELPEEKYARKLAEKAAKAEASAQAAASEKAQADAAAEAERQARELKEARQAKAQAQAERARALLKDVEGEGDGGNSA